MKALVALIMCAHVWLACIAPGGLMEFFRLPELADHFKEHSEESGGSLTIVDFLVMHYFDIDHEQRDGARHGSLPFHHTAGASPFYVTNFTPPQLALSEVSLSTGIEPMDLWACGQWPGRSVFHPPKLNG
ncbi:MAG: hypothetical protein IPH53_17810 [Flavobacteriales bacterium]|nr:hypothetical protein [Flavobacteriales bacterium]